MFRRRTQVRMQADGRLVAAGKLAAPRYKVRWWRCGGTGTRSDILQRQGVQAMVMLSSSAFARSSLSSGEGMRPFPASAQPRPWHKGP